MSDNLDLTRRIADLNRRARTDGVSADLGVRAAWFDEKAAVFEAIAAARPELADESAESAANARAHAAFLRAAGGVA